MGMITFRANKFTAGTEVSYVAEASSLGLKPGEVHNNFILVVSPRQRELMVMFKVDRDRSGEGDVHGWHYKSTTSTTTVLIIND
jgi:hypothetical protein